MTTVLQYLVIAAVIGLVLFGLALLLFGRGERLSALPARTSPARLPERGIRGADVREVRFALALRGYRMSDVDWTLERLADELDRTRQELALATGSADSDPGRGDLGRTELERTDVDHAGAETSEDGYPMAGHAEAGVDRDLVVSATATGDSGGDGATDDRPASLTVWSGGTSAAPVTTLGASTATTDVVGEPPTSPAPTDGMPHRHPRPTDGANS
ncbi:DivIVA domain-containing protein [Nakamurella deserti]|uniref:DivIVA domain-containing protein n=1 Tax=Nakamurella deserti TaxID=2164074 RepID=UPI00197C1588|nr:DivIVA domain-containing protein [Nakamurella deserti]